MLFRQEISDDLILNDAISGEELINGAKSAIGNLNLQLAAIRKMWDQTQIAKNQLEEIIGIDDMELE